MYAADCYDADTGYGGLMTDDNFAGDNVLTNEERVMLGVHKLMPEEASDEEGNDGAMDEGDDADDAPVATWLGDMPTPSVQHLESGPHDTFRFRWGVLPKGMPGFPAHVMAAVGKNEELMRDNLEIVARQPCLPMIMHASPLVALFSAHYQAPRDYQGADLSTLDRPFHARRTTLHDTLSLLLELYGACINGGVIRLHTSVTSEMQSELLRTLRASHEELSRINDTNLDALFEAVDTGAETYQAALPAFVQLCERYGVALVHLYERFLHEALIAPHAGAPALATVLTPAQLPDTVMSAAEADNARKQALEFFMFKANMRKSAEEEAAALGQELVDKGPWRLRVEMLQGPVSGSNNYRGFLPLDLIRDYFHYMDTQGKCARFIAY